MSRIRNSYKNMKFEFIGQASGLLISFISRMAFVRVLSMEYLGLYGLFSNILSILSFAELGVGAAIGYSLYKPLSERNIPEIKALMGLYKKTYITIGIVIAASGTALTPFLHFIIKDMPDIPNIQIIYLMFVANSAVSYFFSYKRSLIIADQKRYISTYFKYVFFTGLNIVQIIVLLAAKSYLLFLGLQILFTFLENYTVSKKADRLYPYLKTPQTEGLKKRTKRTIVRNIKAMIYHKIGGIAVSGTDSLLLSMFTGVASVGVYSNYLLIINAVNQVINIIFQAVASGVGNLGATETKDKSLFIFRCLNLAGFWGFGFASLCLFYLLNPFIKMWLGDIYLFPLHLVLIIVINFYLTGMRRSVLTFRDALGLYWYDRYKPIFESAINLVSSVILVKRMGIPGIFIGTALSTLTTCFWVEPYVLYKYGFKASSASYFSSYIIHTCILLAAGGGAGALCGLVKGDTIIAFILKALICFATPNMVFLAAFHKTQEFKYLLQAFKAGRRRKALPKAQAPGQ